MPTSGTKRLLTWIGYAVFFLVAFLLSAYWTFPYDCVRDYVVTQVEYPMGPDGRRHPSGYGLEIADLSPSFITGVEMNGVHFAKDAEAPGQAPLDLTVDELDARVSLLSLLAGNLAVSFDATLDGGEIEGSYEDSDQETHVQADVRGVNLRRLGILRAAIGLPVRGVVNGKIDVTLAEKLADTKGNIALDIQGLGIGDGHSKLPLPGMHGGLTVARVAAGNLTVRVSAENGLARIDRLHADGKDAKLDAVGTIRLLRPLSMSRVDLMTRVKFTDAYRNRNDKTRAILSLLDFNPKLRAARTSDGWLQYRWNGSLGSRILPTPAGHAPFRKPGR